MSCAQVGTCMHIALHKAALDVSACRLLPPATCMGNRLISEDCLHCEYPILQHLLSTCRDTSLDGSCFSRTHGKSRQLQIGCTLSQSPEMYPSLPLQLKPRLTSTILAVPHRCHG
ncbi:hypothetical protein B0H14DRAFT_3881964, partial [Mycena olivaceomarginata]